MKSPLAAVMVHFAAIVPSVVTQAPTRSPAMYGYCLGCTEWKERRVKKNDNFFPTATTKTAPPAAAYRSNFIPCPTRLVSATPAAVPVSEAETIMKADSIMPLVTTKRLVSPRPTHRKKKQMLLDSDLPKQQFEEESFLLLLCFLIAAAAAYYVIMTTSYTANDDKLSSSCDEEEDMLELAPTIDDEDEQEDGMLGNSIMETKSKSILVGSFSSEGKCVVNKLQKAEKRVQFQDMPPLQEEDSTFFSPNEVEGFAVPAPWKTPSCFNSFQDMISNEILKSLLEDPVEKCDTSSSVQAVEKMEEEPQDKVENSSTTPQANESEEEERSFADLNMIREYEDFLFQVSHSLQ